MECFLEEDKAICKILDVTPNSAQKNYSLVVRQSYTVKQLIDDISTQYNYKSFEITLQSSKKLGNDVKLNGRLDEKLSDIGIDLKQKNFLVIKIPSTTKEPTEPVLKSNNIKKEVEASEPVLKSNKLKKEVEASEPVLKSNKLKKEVEASDPVLKSNKFKKEVEAKTTNMINNNSAKHQEIAIETEISSDDDLALGASASPNEQISNSPTTSPTIFDKPPALEAPLEPSSASSSSFNRCNDFQSKSSFFVGLVNQAMTCYMNSLLQSLYMTPEFRNALYNWEFDGTGESKSIPFQLQKLFINLQTSNKMAVETTDLTKSFGWDSTEAWQQHDIQELCRVMFDALEQKFKHTKHADLINRLYEGKMIDYVKCLECETEKNREDTFLDIPLPVRPFGSNVAYESVEEAIKAFVQPETLDGNNQYFCEKCNKKCDAHKGLKFSKFPYILTLHLKRFDFDYQTLHRIKLNDKVSFPQQLNLNSFINNSLGFESQAMQQVPTVNVNATKPSDVTSIASVESAVKCDDSSTTDSVLDDEGSVRINVQNLDTEQTEDDEGIDMSVNDSKSFMSNSTSIDSSTNNNNNNTGPYNYELFSIMIHSGSASGGHYYAYIKDFESNNWFSFNDQTVSTITQEDICKTFGGGGAAGAFKSYYSGFSSSTNAYMLMYRQQDPTRNCSAVKEENFPVHIKSLVERVRNRDENDRRQKELESEMVKLKIYFKNPYTRTKVDTKVFMISESTLQETLEDAYSRLKIKSIAPIGRCRLVAYENSSDSIEKSFEGCDKDPIGLIMSSLCNRLELLLEVREEDQVFEIYYPGGIMTRVYQVHVNHPLPDDIDGPFCVRGYEQKPISDYKIATAEKLFFLGSQKPLLMAFKNTNDKVKIVNDDTRTLRSELIYGSTKVFVTTDVDEQKNFQNSIYKFENLFALYFLLPNNKKDTLEKLSIPSYEPNSSSSSNNSVDVVDSVAFALPTINNNNNNNNNDNCNSEDSSLSDSDRTLVEDSFQMCKAPPNPPSMHQSPYGDHVDKNGNDDKKYFFKGIMSSSKNGSGGSVDSGNDENYEESADSELNPKMLKVLVDKRMSVNKLKELIQPFVKIPMEYFKIFRQLQMENECTRLQDSLSVTFKDDERLVIELGRALRKGEFKVKLYYLNILEVTDIEKLPFVCDYILRNGAEVGQTKREILAHIGSVDEKYSKLTYERSRLRKKNWKSPTQIFIDDQKFGDDIIISSTTQFEIIIQEMPENSSTLDSDGQDITDDCRSIFIRQFYPSKLDLGKFDEIVVGKTGELKRIISKLSDIAEENVMYTKLNRSFLNMSVMQIEGLSWHHQRATLDDDSPLGTASDGFVFLYKDKTEIAKTLTAEERYEISKKENQSAATTTSYSPRRERGLKIYISDSPRKSEDSSLNL
ncbi:unnamed protein product [Diamesa serratosioi]